MKILYTILLICFAFPKNMRSHAPNVAVNNSIALLHNDALKKASQDKASESNDSKKASEIAYNKEKLFGVASLYSPDLEGTETATGETFEHDGFTAASNNFKLNTWVKVTNLRNGKSVVVRINDRMHPGMAQKGRVVDLTLSAAKKSGLSFLVGLTKVKVEKISIK